ncbi:hypothetical protein DPEC_G00301480 [Dallia pectoralis]|uniref:Uncharacterized protein n=1 Tax=Dallia pectoralis TaxID=75939 RepID=A0ACC2FGT9_DALPE|nr:hypothetical protein DPEC_G00301480 [Dallia pectoralis]
MREEPELAMSRKIGVMGKGSAGVGEVIGENDDRSATERSEKLKRSGDRECFAMTAFSHYHRPTEGPFQSVSRLARGQPDRPILPTPLGPEWSGTSLTSCRAAHLNCTTEPSRGLWEEDRGKDGNVSPRVELRTQMHRNARVSM